MKNTFTKLTVVLFITVFGNAGYSQMPDFSETDMNGNAHNLYTDYINQGKPVVIDIFTTWCGPCWGLHQSHVLNDFYNQYGPNGTGDAMVFGIESDMTTDSLDLVGQTANSMGNWLNGIDYPIIDDIDESVINSIGGAAYPTLLVVCPDGSATGYPIVNSSIITVDQQLHYSNLTSGSVELADYISSKCGLYLANEAIDGIDDILTMDFSNNKINLKLKGDHSNVRFKLVDILGREIASAILNTDQSISLEMNRSNVSSEIYFATIEVNGKLYSEKIIL